MGLLCIAGFLKERGIKVKVWDPSVYDEDFIIEIKEFNPDIIGISLMTAQYVRAKEIIHLLRKKIPQATYICGGPHVSALPEETLIGLNADAAIVGEGELTVDELCRCHMMGHNWREVEGISYIVDGEVYHNPRRRLIDDLDAIPFVGRELLSTPFYWYLIPPGVIRGKFYLDTTTMITSRGCPYNCIFCASNVTFGHHFRRRSVLNVIEEIRYLRERYGVKRIWFLDDIFTFDRCWVERFCSVLVEQRVGLIWSCQTRADTLDAELLNQMKLAGCVQLEIGVESGSDKVLKALSKNICLDDLKEKFAQMKQLGLRTMANFMIGNPEENMDDIMATYRLAKHLNPDFIEFNVCTPYPGSRLYQTAREKKWLAKDRADFDSEWSEHFTNAPVMHINIEPQHLLRLRAKLQNRFLWKNYANIIGGFLRSSTYLFLLIRSIFSYLKKNYRVVCILLMERRFDTVIWNFYTHYSKIARAFTHNGFNE